MKLDKYDLPSAAAARSRRRDNTLNIRDSFVIPEDVKDLGVNKKFFLKTYGCQANVRDSETIRGILLELGFEETEDENVADFILLNTCAIRKNAEDKVLGLVGQYKHLKKANPDLVLGLCGCMAQEEEMVKMILQKYKQVDLIFGTHNIYNLPKLLYKALKGKERTVEVYSKEGDVIENLPANRFESHRAWVNIMYGCNKFCTYCIVPYTRGRERSRLLEDIIDEVNGLIKDGYKEVTLLGQNVNAYGKDLDLGYDFGDLMEEVAKTGIERIRFMTSYPSDFNERMVEIFAKYPNIMPYIHLPLQSGNNEVLKLMGRRYTKEEYIALFDKIKELIPNCAVTTDIIVAFPNETEEAFKETLDMVEYCKYDNAFTFIYSPREGTPAAKMENLIPEAEKESRLQRLNERVNFYANQNNQAYFGREVEVLVDGFSKKNKTVYSGYTQEFKLVNFTGENVNVGDLVKVKITKCNSWSLDGEKIA